MNMKSVLKLVTFLTLIFELIHIEVLVSAEDVVSGDSVVRRKSEQSKISEDYSVESIGKDNREPKEYAYDGWRAVDTHSEGVSGWIPHESQEQVPKRRRIKKRKRRPPTVSMTSEETSQENEELVLLPRRRVQPHILEEKMPEPWEEMSEDQGRPYIRRRLTPSYKPSEEILVTSQDKIDIGTMEQTIQFPEEDEDNSNEDTNNEEVKLLVPSTSETISKSQDLKAILKTRGGLSLSEILQQKNLSLSELLSGNQKAISALTEGPLPSTSFVKTTTEPDIESTKYKRLPPSVGLRKNINRNFEQDNESIESMSTKETLEAQRKRLALLPQNKDNQMYFEVTKFEVVTEPTTEKRIFVPSHPKLYTSVDYKPDFFFPDQTTEIASKVNEHTTENILVTQASTSTSKPKAQDNIYNSNNKIYNRMFLKPKLKITFPTSEVPKLNDKIIFRDEDNDPDESYFKIATPPPNAIKISVKEILGYIENQKEDKNDDGPIRMSIDLGNFVEKTTKPKLPPKLFNFKHMPTTKMYYTTTTTTTTESPTVATTTETIPEKLHPFTAKDEIMEILKDPVGREKLSGILSSRNMTIQELVDLRERGSSQLHLADIFHNKTREPEPREEPFIGSISSEFFDNFPVFTNNRQQKSLFNKNTTTTQKPIDIVEKSNKSNPEIVTVTSFPTFKIEINKELNENKSSQEQFPWKQLYPDLFQNQNSHTEKAIEPILSEEDIQRIDEIESQLASASNEKLNVEETDEVFITLPSGVKSAILASLAIIGLSLLVFLTILFIFRWSQKHRQKLNYCNSLSSRIKSPILEASQRNIKTFMTETLGRKKNYYKSHLQSMSDNIWQNERAPSY